MEILLKAFAQMIGFTTGILFIVWFMNRKSSKEVYYHYDYMDYILFKEIVEVYKIIGGDYGRVALETEKILKEYKKDWSSKTLKEAHDVINSIKIPDDDVWQEACLKWAEVKYKKEI
ncbi:hypothetical protein EEL30_21490 [Brevibacillus laterosporus]|uniref:Uncharacterized protein n=1 Tax=Brevibacillus laterosporus TaxID=1465 RepID=A0A518VC99_BRELA|nr:hypothetical protein EEL30_21490 [Brevibacillus laterosporus]